MPLEDDTVVIDDEEEEVAPLLQSATPTVVEIGAGTPLLMLRSVARLPDRPRAFVSAPAGTSGFVFA
jgi:hypothetical protein